MTQAAVCGAFMCPHWIAQGPMTGSVGVAPEQYGTTHCTLSSRCGLGRLVRTPCSVSLAAASFAAASARVMPACRAEWPTSSLAMRQFRPSNSW